MKRTLITYCLLAAALSGCAAPKPPVAKVGDIAPGSFQRSWSVKTGVKSISNSYLAGNMLFVYGPDRVVAAFDTNGVPAFRTPIGLKGDSVGPPMVGEDSVVFPTGATLEFLTRKGVITRTLHLSQPPRSAGVLTQDTVFMGTDSDTGGRIAAVALDRGEVNIYRWTLLSGLVRTTPVLYNNALYSAAEDGRVIALNLNRTPLWPAGPELRDGIFRTDGQIIADIKVDDAGVYVPSTDTKLYCLNPASGRLQWEYYAGSRITQSPVPTTDMVYVQVRGKGIVALPKKAAQRVNMPAWNYANGVQVLGDDASYAYFLDTSGKIVAIEKSTGNLRFMTERNDFASGITHIDPKDSTLYVLTKANELIAVSPVLKTGVVGELVMNDTRGDH